jgi:DNA-directed RNA polymerase sigma subunit (sigma70/sigma32)
MTTFNQKHQIMESLDSLDQRQTEEVLEYIKGLFNTPRTEADLKKFKQHALKEIRQALKSNTRKLRPSF